MGDQIRPVLHDTKLPRCLYFRLSVWPSIQEQVVANLVQPGKRFPTQHLAPLVLSTV